MREDTALQSCEKFTDIWLVGGRFVPPPYKCLKFRNFAEQNL